MLQTCSVLKVHNGYNTRIQQFQGGRARYKLIVSLKFTTTPSQRYSGNFRVDVRFTSLFMVSLKFTTRTLQGYRSFGVDFSRDKLAVSDSSQGLRRSRYRVTVSLKFRTQQYRNIDISGWMVAFQFKFLTTE